MWADYPVDTGTLLASVPGIPEQALAEHKTTTGLSQDAISRSPLSATSRCHYGTARLPNWPLENSRTSSLASLCPSDTHHQAAKAPGSDTVDSKIDLIHRFLEAMPEAEPVDAWDSDAATVSEVPSGSGYERSGATSELTSMSSSADLPGTRTKKFAFSKLVVGEDGRPCKKMTVPESLSPPLTINKARAASSLLDPDHRMPGPMTIEGEDVPLMVSCYGSLYADYQAARTRITEELESGESGWVLSLQSLLLNLLRDVMAKMGPFDDDFWACSDTVSESPLIKSCPVDEDLMVLTVLAVLHFSPELDVRNAMENTLKTPFCCRTLLSYLDSFVQFCIDFSTRSDESKEAALTAPSDTSQNGSDSLLEKGNALWLGQEILGQPLPSMQRKLTYLQMSQLLCQLPSPELLFNLPGILQAAALPVLRISLRIRSVVVASLILERATRLNACPSAVMCSEVTRVLDRLPLYLDGSTIPRASEDLVMAVSSHAPMDFDDLDSMYEYIIKLFTNQEKDLRLLVSALAQEAAHELMGLPMPQTQLEDKFADESHSICRDVAQLCRQVVPCT